MCRWLELAKESRDLSYKELKRLGLDKYVIKEDDGWSVSATDVMEDGISSESVYMVSTVVAFDNMYMLLKEEYDGKEPLALAMKQPGSDKSGVMDALENLNIKKVSDNVGLKAINLSEPTDEDIEELEAIVALMKKNKEDK